MLNRIYIVVGIFAILVLAGAFIAPRFIQWSDYRDRMEDLASGVMGAEVTIRGDISFSLLPRPRLEFADVVVGDIESPAATVGTVEAEFALLDFLRDNYNVTALVLVQPVVDLIIDENGLFTSSIDIAGTGHGVALGQARISNGSVRLTDLRADEVFTATRLDGELKLSSFVGPFQFQGAADYDGTRYDIRFNSGTIDAAGSTRVSSSLRATGGAFSVAADGVLATGPAPKFEGNLVYRQAPPAAEQADDIRGQLVLESQVVVSTDRATITNFTLLPDENRVAMRLTGTAAIQLGARREFDAVISGGVFSLPPRDATEVASELPYELVRLLSEIPAPPIPPMPGRLGIDLAEVGLRGFTLRELRLEALTDGSAWDIRQGVANLPGETEMRVSGRVGNDDGVVSFLGDFSVNAQRLDGLAQLWRRPSEDNPLFNTPGALSGRLMLAGDAFGLSNGQFTFAGQTHTAELRLGFGLEPRLDAVLHLGTLSAAQTTALLALLPDVGNEPSFRVSFPNGSFSLTADRMDVAGIGAESLVAEGQWSPTDLRFARLAASDWGGLGLSTSLRLSGDLGDPRVTGSGDLSVRAGDGEGLVALYELAGVPFSWQEGLVPAWPATLQFILTDNERDSGQVLTLAGELAGADFDFRAEMAEGLSRIGGADLRLVTSLEGADGLALQDRLGLGTTPLFSTDEPLIASVFVEGSGSDGFEGRVGVSQGPESLNYFGRLEISGSGVVSGEGSIDAVLDNASGLAALAGARGTSLPSLDANAAIRFEGTRSMNLDSVSGIAGTTSFSGVLALQQVGQLPALSGNLELDTVDIAGLGTALLGAEAFAIPGDGTWPEGPLAVAVDARPSRGAVNVAAEGGTLFGQDVLGATSFTFSWDQQTASIESLQSDVGGGRLGLSLSNCCAGPLSERTLSGRISLADVDVDALLPPLAGAGLSGVVTGGLQFEGSGQSLADVMRSMTGEGNFSVADFAATGLSADVFPTIAGIEDPLNTEADALETLIALGLGQGTFVAAEARGAFSIAGGTARLANLIIEGTGGLLSGSLNLALPQLGLDGSFVLTPRNYTDAGGLVQNDTARIIARIGGSLVAPLVTLDLTEMVAAIQVRANELEVDRLEALRIEDEARQREAAEARNRLIQEQQRRAAEEAARRAAEEAAEQEALNPPPVLEDPAAPPGEVLLDLGFQPLVNQPTGPAVNQPIQLIPQN